MLTVLETIEIPETLAEAYRTGWWGYQSELRPLLDNFNPWSMLAVLPAHDRSHVELSIGVLLFRNGLRVLAQ